MFINTLSKKNDFPIFDNNNLIYLDSASTSQKPTNVINGIKKVYERSNANVHRALYNLGSESTRLFESARKNISGFINAGSAEEIIFTGGTTESINLLAYTLGSRLDKNDEILISQMEHHANIVPWQQLANRSGVKLRYLPITDSGELDLSQPEKYFTKKTKIVSITHMSNVLGTVNPIKKISEISKNIGAVLLLMEHRAYLICQLM